MFANTLSKTAVILSSYMSLFIQNASATVSQSSSTTGSFIKSFGIPCPVTVGVVNKFEKGELMNKFRDQIIAISSAIVNLNLQPVKVTYNNACNKVPFKSFANAVLKAAMCADNADFVTIIKYIYKAFCSLKGNETDLVNFTSIALHNMYCFKKFTEYNENDKQIGNACRGLLQLKSKKYYEAISKITHFNYMKKPNQLNKFSKKSIMHEAKLFLAIFAKKRHSKKRNTIVQIVKMFASNDSKALKCDGAVKKTASACIKAQIKRRIKIYNILYCLLLKYKNISSRK